MKKRLLVVATMLALSLPAFAKEVLPFIENDYTKAAALARTKNLPLFVDAWAPW